MELWPALELDWLNGWISLALLALTDGVLFLSFGRGVTARLWDRSGWSRKQVRWTVVGKLCALAGILLLIWTPLKVGTGVFWVGAVVTLLGLAGLISALFAFRNTPPSQPVTGGIYCLSRHPQIVMAAMVLLGGCIAIGSWPALLAVLAGRVFGHLSILAEEEVCLQQYGEAYRAYMNRVPRYFLVF